MSIVPRASIHMDDDDDIPDLSNPDKLSKEDIKKLADYVVQLQKEDWDIKKENNSLFIENEKLENEVQDLKKRNKELINQNVKMKDEKFSGNPLLEENQKLKNEIQLLNREMRELTSRNNELNDDLEKLATEKVNVLEQEKKALAARISELEESAEKKNNSEQNLISKVDVLQKDLKSLNHRIARTRSARIKSIKYESKRGNVLREFFFTEKTYLRCLEVLKDEYMNNIINKSYIPKKDFKIIFSPLIKILVVNQTFCKRLEKVLFCNTRDEELIRLVLQFSQTFKKEYSIYIKAFENIKALFMTYLKKSKKFEKFIKKKTKKLKEKSAHEKYEVGEHVDLGIHSLMIAPIQRLPRYALLLRDLQKYTKKEKSHYAKLEEAIQTIRDINQYCDKQLEEFLLEKISKDLNIKLGKKKIYIHTLPIERRTKGGRKKVDSLLFIFNDLLIVKDMRRGITKPKQFVLELSKEKTEVCVAGEDDDQLLIETKGKDVLLIEIVKRSKFLKVMGVLKKLTKMEIDEKQDDENVIVN